MEESPASSFWRAPAATVANPPAAEPLELASAAEALRFAQRLIVRSFCLAARRGALPLADPVPKAWVSSSRFSGPGAKLRHPVQDASGVVHLALVLLRKHSPFLQCVSPACESSLTFESRVLAAAVLFVAYKLVSTEPHFKHESSLQVLLATVLLPNETPKTAAQWNVLRTQQFTLEASIVLRMPLLTIYCSSAFYQAEKHLQIVLDEGLVSRNNFVAMLGALGFLLNSAEMYPSTAVLLDLEAGGVDSNDIGAGAAAALFACLCAATLQPGHRYQPPTDVDVALAAIAILEAAIQSDDYLRVGPYELGCPDEPVKRLVHPPTLREAKELLAQADA